MPKLFYARRPEEEIARDKLAFLDRCDLSERDFALLKPDAKGNWLTGEHRDWVSYLPLADPEKGPGDAHGAKVEAIFRLSSNGLQTKRNEWAYDESKADLGRKMEYMIASYEAVRLGEVSIEQSTVKWDTKLDQLLGRRTKLSYSSDYIVEACFRPFVRKWLYADKPLNGATFKMPHLFKNGEHNTAICVRGVGSNDPLATLATNRLFDLDLLKTGNGVTAGVTRYRYTKSGERVDNVTNWALARFRERYSPLPLAGEGGAASAAEGEGARAEASRGPRSRPHPDPLPQAGEGEGGRSSAPITKDDIFAYCYAALHDPAYCETHADDLRREFPRVPLHDDFWTWRDWGETLQRLHIDYEQVEPWPLTRADAPGDRVPTPKLKSHPDKGLVVVDSRTQLTGIPLEAWTYRLGNRAAIDWVLDQHKEKPIRDATVRAKFNTYRFADHKETMIALLAKVVRVSMETVAITAMMRARSTCSQAQIASGKT